MNKAAAEQAFFRAINEASGKDCNKFENSAFLECLVLHQFNTKVADALDTLCKLDPRYISRRVDGWTATDASSVKTLLQSKFSKYLDNDALIYAIIQYRSVYDTYGDYDNGNIDLFVEQINKLLPANKKFADLLADPKCKKRLEASLPLLKQLSNHSAVKAAQPVVPSFTAPQKAQSSTATAPLQDMNPFYRVESIGGEDRLIGYLPFSSSMFIFSQHNDAKRSKTDIVGGWKRTDMITGHCYGMVTQAPVAGRITDQKEWSEILMEMLEKPGIRNKP